MAPFFYKKLFESNKIDEKYLEAFLTFSIRGFKLANSAHSY